MEFNTLIATNVISRGFDVPEVDLVINLDLPRFKDEAGFYEPDYENFLHRVGRTGRFGTDGVALTIYKDGEANEVTAETDATEDYDESVMVNKIIEHYGIEIKEERDLNAIKATIDEMRGGGDL